MNRKSIENKEIFHAHEKQIQNSKLKIKSENAPEYVNIYWDEWKK